MTTYTEDSSAIYSRYFTFDNTQSLCQAAFIPTNAQSIIISNGPSVADSADISSYDSALVTVRHYATPATTVAEAQNDCFPLAIGSTVVWPVGYAQERPAGPSYVLLSRLSSSPRTGAMCISVTFILYNAGSQGGVDG